MQIKQLLEEYLFDYFISKHKLGKIANTHFSFYFQIENNNFFA